MLKMKALVPDAGRVTPVQDEANDTRANFLLVLVRVEKENSLNRENHNLLLLRVITLRIPLLHENR